MKITTQFRSSPLLLASKLRSWGVRPTPQQLCPHKLCLEVCARDEIHESKGFDLAHCIALAGCSFEAYRDPISTYRLGQSLRNGTVTYYTDKLFVSEKFDGLLKVDLHRACNLPAKDLLGKSDPYVILNVGTSSATSSTKDQNLNPTWDETFYLYVKDKDHAFLSFHVYDENSLKADNPLGVTFFSLSKLPFHKSVEVEGSLKGDGGGGVLIATIKLIPFETTTDMESIVETKQVNQELSESLHIEEDIPDPWRALAVMAGKRAEEAFDPVCFIENKNTDTQVWMYRNLQKKECVVAFRGTEQVKWKDLATDADTEPAVFDIERSSMNPFLFAAFAHKSAKEPLVHKGFLKAYDSVKKGVASVIELITDKDPTWTIYTTGHSLGGALATLCAFELACRWIRDPPEIKMYNFGSPRVGNQFFVDEYNNCISESWRIVSKKDFITTIPRLAGYSHVHHAVLINQDGSLEFENGDHKDVFEGRVAEDVITELSQMISNHGGFQQLRNKIVEYELELMTCLMDGSGLEEHMEDNYLSCLLCSITSSQM